jgi:hypothetical protein
VARLVVPPPKLAPVALLEPVLLADRVVQVLVLVLAAMRLSLLAAVPRVQPLEPRAAASRWPWNPPQVAVPAWRAVRLVVLPRVLPVVRWRLPSAVAPAAVVALPAEVVAVLLLAALPAVRLPRAEPLALPLLKQVALLLDQLPRVVRKPVASSSQWRSKSRQR